ncbi:MAG: glycoside hydrolase family 5 protein [Sedimentisphaerales bacterium]|nr:glycoside hydrolase family 5 protein [Sedimentisphaerales bacterium]
MKRAIFLLLIAINSAWAIETPFNSGVNVTGWFQSQSAGQIQFTKYTKQDLVNIKYMGCDVVRLPINLHAMTSGSPGYTIDPLLFTLLDHVVDWAEELDLYLILDNHSFDPDVATPANIGDILVPVWTQMAQHYKNRSNLVCYEILNEPHGISDQDWNNIQQTVIDAIRAVDSVHSIIVGPANFNSYKNLDAMPSYTDDNLIYTFHFYDPFIFTHQGTTWTDPSMESVVNIPFPHSYSKMPGMPSQYSGTWIEDAYNNYSSDGQAWEIYESMQIIADFKDYRHVPVFCGEFGVYKQNAIDAHRNIWYFLVRMFLDYYGVSWTTWEYKGDFGLFEKDTYELFNSDLNVPLVKLLGFYAPEQWDYYKLPDMSGFDIYTDYVGTNIIESSGLNLDKLDYYSENSPADANFCIHFTGVDQYGKVSLRFVPVKDLSYLKSGNYKIDFYVRSNDPSTEFDIRFVDTKTGWYNDHPWRMRYKIDNSIAVWDGNWNHISIPLKNFTEHGSYDDGWYDPVGAFSWYNIELFEIVAEYGDLIGTDLYFDNISIVAP